MPPRFAYWTILIDNKPTAFRARDRQELLPTIAQLKRTNEHVEMRWFAHGKLWDSPEAQRAAERRPPPREQRDRDWRPGGQHKDPRARFDKEARRRKKREERANWDASRAGGGAGRDREASRSRPARPDRPWHNKPTGPPRPDRPWHNKPTGPPRPDRPWHNKPKGAPRHDRPRTDRPGKDWKDRPRGEHKPWQTRGGDRPRGERKPWQKPPDHQVGRPRHDRPHSNNRPRRPPGDRPWRKRKDEPPDEG